MELREYQGVRFPITDLTGPLRTVVLALNPDAVSAVKKAVANGAESQIGTATVESHTGRVRISAHDEEVKVDTAHFLELVTYLDELWRSAPVLPPEDPKREVPNAPAPPPRPASTLVRPVLVGELSVPMRDIHVNRLDPLLDLRRYGADAVRERVRSEFVGLLLDEEPDVRAAAVVFFRTFCRAEDEGALTHAFSEHLDLFDTVPNPWNHHTSDLRGILASALAGRYSVLDEVGKAIVRREAHRPDHGQMVAAGLTRSAPHVIFSNATAIAFASPLAVRPILVNMARLGYDIEEIVALLRPVVDEAVLTSALQVVEQTEDRNRAGARFTRS